MSSVPKIKYQIEFDDDWSDLAIEFHMIRNGGRFQFEGEEVGEGLFYHYKAAQALLWPSEYTHRWTDLILSEILGNTITAITGPKDCVAGHTRILNPITGDQPTIDELCNSNTEPIVMTQLGPIKATVPFLKGEKELFEVKCDDGSKFTATANHFVLTNAGYVPVASLTCGDYLLGYDVSHRQSTLEFGPSIQQRGVQHYLRTVPDSQADCHSLSCSCDAQPHRQSKVCQSLSPSHGDALKRNRADLREDDLVNGQIYNLWGRSPYHLSNCHSQRPHRSKSLKLFEGFHSSAKIEKRECDLFRQLLRLNRAIYFQKSSSILTHDVLCRHSSCKSSQSFFQSNPRILDNSLPHFQIALLEMLQLEHDDEYSKTSTSFLLHGDRESLPLRKYMAQRKRVQQIRSVGIGKFYDLTVPIAHHYFAEGTIHHNTGKTRTAAKYALTDYWAFPEETLFLVSSTTLAALDTRVWGDIKHLFRLAKMNHPWLAGNCVDSKRAIVTDALLENGEVRDMRKGLLCIPIKNNAGEFLSISTYVGIKQKRRRHIGDEFQFCGIGMLDSIANMNSGDYKGIFLGNPIGQNDPLDKVSEPECGWDSLPEPKETTTWKNRRFLDSKTICLYGLDSPAIKEANGASKYPGLLNENSIKRVIAGYGKDSHQYFSQCLGIRRPGMNAKRVVTYELCKQFKAFEPVIWSGTPTTKIFALDAAYGGAGGDRCVGGYGEFGRDVDGKTVLQIHEPVLVPISIAESAGIPEDQIAKWIKAFCETNGIQASNVFYDSTGRGSLGPSLAKIYSTSIQPVEFGGMATLRPVTSETYILDHVTGQRRLKLCREHYSKFVSELWWSARLAIMAEQIRGLPESVVDDGCQRQWNEVGGNKIEVESKRDMKERTGQSPDLFDWFVTIVEGARRRGFAIKAMVNHEARRDMRWLDELSDKARKLRESHALKHAA